MKTIFDHKPINIESYMSRMASLLDKYEGIERDMAKAFSRENDIYFLRIYLMNKKFDIDICLDLGYDIIRGNILWVKENISYILNLFVLAGEKFKDKEVRTRLHPENVYYEDVINFFPMNYKRINNKNDRDRLLSLIERKLNCIPNDK